MTKLLRAGLSDTYTGLTGSVGFAFYNADGTLNTARTTDGVYEAPAGSGTYWVDATIPTGLNGFVAWDVTGHPEVSATEEINTANQEPYIDPGTVNLYCTYADIDNELDDLTNHIPQNKIADGTAWVEAQIYKCMMEIDGRIGGMYTVPFTTPIPSIIRTICIYMSVSRILGPGYVGEVPAGSYYVDANYKRGNDLLKRIESGEIVLTGASVPVDTGVLSNTSDQGFEFTQNVRDSDGNVTEFGSMNVW